MRRQTGVAGGTYGGTLPFSGEEAIKRIDESGPAMTFPHKDEDEIGETKRIAEEEAAFEASEKSTTTEDHAVGGSEGTTDGQ